MNPIAKRDYAIGALVGFLTGVFAIPVLVNIGVDNKVLLALMPLLVAIGFFFGVWLGGFLGRWMAFFSQFGKFAAVGFLNTAIDFGLLNLLASATGITAGLYLGGINVPAVMVALTNSYFWNKYWVFKAGEGSAASDLPKFIAVSVGAILINSGIVAIGTGFSASFGLSAEAWLNAVKVLATVASFLWNFVGYKIFVFRTRAPAGGV
ncbi:MAG: GtrA family protein [Patescibacteria group bacterium]